MSVCDEDVDLQSWGWTDLSSDSSSLWDPEHQSWGIMSRRSLRLDDGLLDRSLPHSSASFSVGGGVWRSSSRSLKSRRSQQQSVTCSESLLLSTPRKAPGPSLLNSSLHSVASDASLLSSLLDESSVQEATLVDAFWGLDHDVDPKESTVIAEQSTVLADRTLIGSDGRCPKHLVQTLSSVYCRDCELHSDRKESAAAAAYTSSSLTRPPPSEPETSTIYSRDRRDRSRRSRTAGVLASLWCGVVKLLALLLQKHHRVTDVLQLWCDSSVLCVRRAAAGCVSALTHAWQVCVRLRSQVNTAAESTAAGGVMKSSTNQTELHPDTSLCEDCQEQRRSETDTVTSSPSSSSWSSVASCLLVLMWSAAVLAGQAAGDVFRRLNRRHQMTPGFLPTRCPLSLLLLLLPLLLLFSLSRFGPAALQSVSIIEWRTAVSDVPGLSSVYSFMSLQSQPAEGAAEESREVQLYEEEPLYGGPPAAAEEEESTTADEAAAAAADESLRLAHLEQSLTALWERVEAGGQRAEQRHGELLRLYADLQQQMVSGQSDWLSRLMDQQLDQQLDLVRRPLDEQGQQTEQSRQQSETSRLDQLELQLQTLAARTEEEQRRRDAARTESPSPTTLPAAVSGGVDRQSHDALLAEVARLEAALEDVRRDVEGLSGCQDGCGRLDRIQQTISEQLSAQVREEVRVLVYGNQLTVGGGASGDGGPPESLLQWLSQRYVSGADLQASLASLELSILQNISQQLEQRRGEETVREAVLHAAEAGGAGVTQEDVHVIVKNALRLFSQDRTGLADYALESGGGSILSTRCSETYETKAALLSLFGLPLWYFSQSPRAVIQPDVHPGNCWAFRGSRGFLVIRLSMRIVPSSFSLEHIPKILAPGGTLRSAPRDFTVYGLEDETEDRGTLLGSYTYDQDGDALQTYSVTEENDRSFQIIEVQVSSNWGHQEYTCMYRFRVHGTPADA